VSSIPTLAAVAKHAGVSSATASRALDMTGRTRVNPDTRRRVLAAVTQLGYRRHRAAPSRCRPPAAKPAEPAAWLAVDTATLAAGARTVHLFPDRQSAAVAANRANHLAPNNGGTATWQVYALVPSHRVEETPSDAR
jgi:hypothetical protein